MLCSPNGQHLAVIGSGDTAVSIINLETGEFETKLVTPGPTGALNVVFEANSHKNYVNFCQNKMGGLVNHYIF